MLDKLGNFGYGFLNDERKMCICNDLTLLKEIAAKIDRPQLVWNNKKMKLAVMKVVRTTVSIDSHLRNKEKQRITRDGQTSSQ